MCTIYGQINILVEKSNPINITIKHYSKYGKYYI